VHDVGIILTGENKSRSSHIGRDLVDLVEAAVDRVTTCLEVCQIAPNEVVGFCFTETRVLQVDTSHPETLSLQSLDKVAPNKTSRSTHQRRASFFSPFQVHQSEAVDRRFDMIGCVAVRN
jgi:hypothetical protein